MDENIKYKQENKMNMILLVHCWTRRKTKTFRQQTLPSCHYLLNQNCHS